MGNHDTKKFTPTSWLLVMDILFLVNNKTTQIVRKDSTFKNFLFKIVNVLWLNWRWKKHENKMGFRS